MVFPVLLFDQVERRLWKANNEGRDSLVTKWFQEMLLEGSVYYGNTSNTTWYDVRLTKKKMYQVMAETSDLGILIKDPFERYQNGDVEGAISAMSDARAVLKWASTHPDTVEKLYRRNQGGYFFSKFRFFKRMHRWMEKTVHFIISYEEAKDLAKQHGYWNCEAVEYPHFSFEEYISHPDDFTEQQFISDLDNARELQELDRMQSSDRDEEEYPSSSDYSSE